MRTGSQVKIGTAKRRDLSEFENTPGPGAYDLNALKNGKNVIITGGRVEKSELYNQPGPATYQPKLEYVKDRPSTSKLASHSNLELVDQLDTHFIRG
jgi:hypothetical protein